MSAVAGGIGRAAMRRGVFKGKQRSEAPHGGALRVDHERDCWTCEGDGGYQARRSWSVVPRLSCMHVMVIVKISHGRHDQSLFEL